MTDVKLQVAQTFSSSSSSSFSTSFSTGSSNLEGHGGAHKFSEEQIQEKQRQKKEQQRKEQERKEEIEQHRLQTNQRNSASDSPLSSSSSSSSFGTGTFTITSIDLGHPTVNTEKVSQEMPQEIPQEIPQKIVPTKPPTNTSTNNTIDLTSSSSSSSSNINTIDLTKDNTNKDNSNKKNTMNVEHNDKTIFDVDLDRDELDKSSQLQKRFSLEVDQVPPDGDCLFEVLRRRLAKNDATKYITVQDIRVKIVDHITKIVTDNDRNQTGPWRETYEDVILATQNEDTRELLYENRDDYIVKMKKISTNTPRAQFGDHMEINAFEELEWGGKRFKIQILKWEDGKLLILRPSNELKFKEGQGKPNVINTLNHRKHYDVLHLIGTDTTNEDVLGSY